ncbi:DUF2314 domain-containing protein [Rhodopseudomonas palustris]|uniref:YegJ family protein n=1 Tax=Rhodopseudomonas palustris TaxID=1076 RepID=UPI002ACDFE09|nr:DUF2314 domain-containing protein [Rhodopseudomonas palustris]WQH01566.1 DUF2314 domain-containing protein [Rhodopseudomonas palustris]
MRRAFALKVILLKVILLKVILLKVIELTVMALTVMALFLSAPAPAGADSLLDRVERDDLHFVPDDDPAMRAAIAKARATLPDFLAKAARPRINQRNFALKVEVGLADGRSEFLWVTRFANQNDDFIGVVDNEPRLVPNLKRGGYLVFKRDEIADWLYLEGDRMIGNATLCAMTASVPEDRRLAREQFGLDCDDARSGAPR